MKAKHTIYVAALVIGTTGCTYNPVDKDPESYTAHSSGIVLVDASRKTYEPAPASGKYYGQLYISAEAVEYKEKEVQSRFEQYIKSTFGGEVQQFGVSVTPVLGGTRLPAVVLFSYRYDSGIQQWVVSRREKYISPTVLIDASTKIEFEINYVYSNDTKATFTQSAATALSSMAALNPGAWILSTLSIPQVQAAASVVDDSISKAMTSSANYSVSSYFQPAGDGSREAAYNIILYGDKAVLGKVTLSTVLSPSLVSKPVVDPRNTPPEADSAINPLALIKKDGALGSSLWQLMQNQGSYVNLKSSASQKGELDESQVAQFEEYCSAVRNVLQDSYGLNYFDSINAMSYILRSTQYTKNSALYTSNCLSGNDKKVLAEMGIPLNGVSPIMVEVTTPSSL